MCVGPCVSVPVGLSLPTSHVHLPAALLNILLLSLLPFLATLWLSVHLCTCVSAREPLAVPFPLLRGAWNLIPGVVFCSVPILVPTFPPASASRPHSWMAFLGTVPWTPRPHSPKTQLSSCPSCSPFSGQRWATRHGSAVITHPHSAMAFYFLFPPLALLTIFCLWYRKSHHSYLPFQAFLGCLKLPIALRLQALPILLLPPDESFLQPGNPTSSGKAS